MNITEKLQTIADNEQRVYDAGYTEGANSVNLDDYVTKSYASDNFVAKNTNTNNDRGVYGKNNNAESFFKVDNANWASVNAIPCRAANGAILIPDKSIEDCGSITQGQQAVNKNYVDNLIADLVARVEALERGGLTGDISFTIDNTTYYADEGMFWGDWCNSRYNTLGLFTNEAQGGAISNDNYTLHRNGSYVLWGDTIENGFDYYLTI